MRVGTWNVRGIYEEEAMINSVNEVKRYKIDLLAVQETHINQTDKMALTEYELSRSRGVTRRYGVGFLVSRELKEKVTKCVPVSERLCYIVIKIEKKLYFLMFMHPQKRKPKRKRMHFMTNLRRSTIS